MYDVGVPDRMTHCAWRVVAALAIVGGGGRGAHASPPAPLEDLLGRAEMVRLMRVTAVTSTDATLEIAETLRGPKTKAPMTFAVEPMQGQPDVGQQYLVISHGEKVPSPPQPLLSLGEPVLGGDYRGWIAFPITSEEGKTYVGAFSFVDCKPAKCDAFSRKLTLRFVRALVRSHPFKR